MNSTMQIDTCADEPIHRPGSIQPHGVLLLVDPHSLRVLHGAGFIEEWLSRDDWHGAGLDDLLGAHVADAIQRGDDELTCTLAGRTGERLVDISVIRETAHWLVELEPASEDDPALGLLEQACVLMDRADSLADMLAISAREFRRLVGYDRVMIYRFLPDGTGKVVAEDRRDDLDSFLNHHFPASDIPVQARALYLRNLVRVIPDATYKPQPLRPPGGQPPHLDMSDCALRSVSPIHLQYLRNMGVAASASFSIVIDGQLWGLVACHATSPQRIGRDRRQVGRLLCSALTRHMLARQTIDNDREDLQLRRDVEQLEGMLRESDLLEPQLGRVMSIFDADGALLLHEQGVRSCGRCPDPALVRQILDWHEGQHAPGPSRVDTIIGSSLPQDLIDPLAAGMLILSPGEGERLVLCRAEILEVINWAGNPHKALGPDGTLTPRASFRSWSASVKGEARPWSRAQIDGAARLAGLIHSLRQTRRISGLNAELQALIDRQDRLLVQRDFLIGEVHHRVQNSIALVSGFLSLQMRGTLNDEVRTALAEARRRISAVGLVHRRLHGPDRDAQQMIDVVRYLGELTDEIITVMEPGWHIELIAPSAKIEAQADKAISIGLILTELIINACKHAYGGSQGPLSLQVDRSDGLLVLSLRDQGKGDGSAGMGTGFGMQMMQALIGQMGGSLEYLDACPGVCARLTLPMATAAAD